MRRTNPKRFAKRLRCALSALALSHGVGVGSLIGAVAYAQDAPARTGRPVTLSLVGVDDPDLHAALLKLGELRGGESEFAAIAPVRRIASADAAGISDALVARGYYQASVSHRVRRTEEGFLVTYTADTGPRFKVTGYDIRYTDPRVDEARPNRFSDIGVSPDGIPTGGRLQSLETELLTYLWENGYPNAAAQSRAVNANFADATGTAVFTVETGAQARFGDIRLKGAQKTRRNYLRALRPFEEGTLIKRSDIEAYRSALTATGLFTSVGVEALPPSQDGIADLEVTVDERKRRTIGAGLSFSTDVGIGTTAFWENRNFNGGAERLSARANISAPIQELGLSYVKPVPRLPGSWRLTGLTRNETTDAFSARSVELGGGLQQLLFNDALQLSAGVEYRLADIDDNDGTTETFSSSSFPLAAVFNNENDPLNPTAGHRGRLAITPFLGSSSFSQFQLGGASRIGFGEDNRTLIAARALFGATLGLDGADLPATERFFAGGGGSVRGFAFQEAGPLDSDNDPLGGASLAEVNIELRQKITEAIQIAAFADAGSVFDSQYPDFSGDLLIGAGLGIRYFTPIGPIRLDVAVPVNGRSIDATETQSSFEDAPLHIYIAVGQPF